jgi:hypothetical protein
MNLRYLLQTILPFGVGSGVAFRCFLLMSRSPFWQYSELALGRFAKVEEGDAQEAPF